MSRPRQDGLLYFSFDTDFFYADKDIKRLRARYGNDGLLFYIYLLTEIYRNGYYIRWNSESVEDAIETLKITEGFIDQVMAFMVSRSLLTKSTLANPDTAIAIKKEGDHRPQCELVNDGNGQEWVTVITSPGIQKRYQEAVKGRKRQFKVNSDIWLLSEEETASCIKVTHNYNFSEKNQNKSEKNKGKSEKNTTKEKESKVNKNKGKEIPRIERFEEFWAAYPNKQRRYLAETAYCDLIVSGSITENELVASARNYAVYIKKSGDRMFLPNNFLEKCVFNDYVEPKHMEAPKKEESETEPVEEMVGDDEEWWKYGPNGLEE